MDRRLPIVVLCCLALLWPVAGAAPPQGSCRTPGQPAFDADTRERAWEDEIDIDAGDGEIDISAYRGGIDLRTWDRAAWRVEIAEHDPYDQLASRVDVDDGNGSFRLRASVGPRDLPPELDPTTPDGAYGQITVTVPDAAYHRLDLHNRPETPSEVRLGDADRPEVDWDSIVVDTIRAEEIRLDPHRASVVGNVTTDLLDVGAGGGALHATDVTADEIRYTADGGELCLSGADGGELDVSTSGAPVRLDDADLGTARLSIEQSHVDIGRVAADSFDVSGSDVAFEAARLAVRDLSYSAAGGSFDARVVPTGSGSWSLDTGEGTIDLSVPTGDAHGYDVEANGRDRRPVLDLPGTEVVDRGPTTLHVRSRGFEDRDTRTRVDANGGDVHADGDAASSGEASVPMPPEAAGIGLAAAVAAIAVVALKAKGVLAPLYTRLSPDEVRDHAVRQQIVEIVSDEPGIHFRELKRRVGAGRGILEHHLEKLVEVGLLDEACGDAYRCYFPGGEVDRRVMAVAERVRADGARAVLSALRERSSASLTELADAADLSSSTAGYHLDRLQDAGLLTKERRGGRLAIDLTDLGTRVLDELRLRGGSEDRA